MSLKDIVGTDHPEEPIRQRWRAAALQSTFFFAKNVVGFADLVDFHEVLAAFGQRPTRRKLALAPRSHCKSSVITISNTLRRVTANPEMRALIINEALINAVHFLAKIKWVIERNPMYAWLFPEVIPDFKKVRWRENEIELKRQSGHPEATISCIGVGGASTSQHYDLVMEDDLVGKEASESALVMEKAIEQHKLAESLLDSPAGEIFTIGTRWGAYDLVDWMLKHEPNLDFFRLSVYKPDGNPLWADRFTPTHLQNLRVKYGAAQFALQYLNEALGDGLTEFRMEWLRYYRREMRAGVDCVVLERPHHEGGELAIPLSEMETFQTTDPCHNPESGDARSANVVVGLTRKNPFNIIMLEATAKKVTSGTLADLMWESHQRWNTTCVAIEVVGAQRDYFYWIPTVYPLMPLRKLKTDTRTSKLSRIRSFGTYAEQGRLYIHRQMVDFMEEWETFPGGKTVDLLDALAYMPQIWAPPEGTLGAIEDLVDEEEDTYTAPQGRNEYTGY